MTAPSSRRRAKITVPSCQLRVLSGPQAGQKLVFQRRQVKIGRAQENDFVLHQDESVSNQHATLLYDAAREAYQLTDNNSQNGIYTKGMLLLDAYLQERVSLELGDSTVEFSPIDGTVSSFVVFPEHQEDPYQPQFCSPAMKEIFGKLACLADVEVPVLLLGETGTGKGTLASQLHLMSERSKHPFIHVNCAAIPESLFEAQFFGYKKGAFTGAHDEHVGFFQQANKGTLFLDEIGELTQEQQSKLLLALDKGEFYPLGATKPTQVDIHLISATNKDLYHAVLDEQFREDVYYRIAVFELSIPPLRERVEDIEQLAKAFLEQFQQEHLSKEGQQGKMVLSQEATARLLQYHWPGNIRHLRNVIFAAATQASRTTGEHQGVVCLTDLPERILQEERPTRPLPTERPHTAGDLPRYNDEKKRVLEAFQRSYIKDLLTQTQNNITRASEISGLNRTHIYALKKDLDL